MTQTIQIISPVDGKVYAQRPIASDAAIEAALTQAEVALQPWRRTPLAERAKILTKAVAAMNAMKATMGEDLAWQMGRPVRYGPNEIARGFTERAEYMTAIAPEVLADIDVGPKEGFKRFIRRDPVGTVFVLAPWNYPYLTAVNSVWPSLLAGNTVILKHSSKTLLVGEHFQHALAKAGLPPGVFQNLVLTHEQTDRVILSDKVQHVAFTGSVIGGREISRVASARLVTVGLELGGKDPAYVRADANFDDAVENLVDGAFFNSGQSCCGVERIYVDKAIYPKFLEAFCVLTEQYVLGNPLDPETTLGPMVSAKAADFVRGQISDAVRSGAKAHIDRVKFRRDAASSPYMAPQVLSKVNHQMRVMREESFGPVIGIMPVANDADAVRLMNDSNLGLTASIWTADTAMAETLGDQIETGTVYMNRCDYLDPALAWTGVKETGRGVTLSKLGFDAVTRVKSFHLKTKG
jgi:acyl-CoA reductase-like NAD-dependent aldehyde dehydrogenase